MSISRNPTERLLFFFHKARLFLHTVIYLRPSQVFYRILYSLNRSRGADRKNIENRLMRLSIPPDDVKYSFISGPPRDYSGVSEGRFCFLNREIQFGREIRWHDPDVSRLWRYNLHYFDFLNNQNGLDTDLAFRMIKDWIIHNPKGVRDAWDSFPLSVRLVNWIKYFLTRRDSLPFQSQIIESIFEQGLWLEKRLEFHLLGNHIFKNGKALIFIGLFFDCEDGYRWLREGLRLIKRELKEQILSDGGHFERSPMYHSMILEDCLDLINILSQNSDPQLVELRDSLRWVCSKMLVFLQGMTHPDGDIALFNDAAMRTESTLGEFLGYYERLIGRQPSFFSGNPIKEFRESGYFVFNPSEENKLIVDCGPIGPDYQPGHSHCDTLSFELSLRGIRVVVDSGCYEYEDTPIRQYNRGNPGHNTVTVDGENQSEVWGSHRCARRAKPIYARMQSNGDKVLRFEGAHDGYRRLSGSPVHHRRVEWYPERIQIEDRVEGSGYHGIESRLHFNPSLDVDFDGKTAMVTANGERLLSVSWLGEGCMEKIYGWYCPEF